MNTLDFLHNPDRNRFEILLDGEVIGSSYYRSEAGQRVFTHTEVDPEYQGQGLAGQLIKLALDETKGEGLRVVPQCPAVAKYASKHPEYDDIIDRDVTPN